MQSSNSNRYSDNERYRTNEFFEDEWLPNTASMREFRRIRQLIAEETQVDHRLIRPETRLGAIIPSQRRDAILFRVTHRGHSLASSDSPVRYPDRNVRVRWMWGTGEVICGLLLGWLCLIEPWFLLFISVPITVLMANIVRPSSVTWPHCLETAHELALSQTHYNEADAKAGLWPRSEISAKVRWIIANQSGYRFSEITEETNIMDL